MLNFSIFTIYMNQRSFAQIVSKPLNDIYGDVCNRQISLLK